jgi:hypothetical protein
MSDDNSTSKIAIGFFPKPDGTRWIYLELLKYGPPHPQLIPSLRDLHRVIQALAICEDEKYPPPARGRGLLVDFLRDAVNCRDWPALVRKYKIPDREGDRVVNANGASLGAHASDPLFPRDREASDDDVVDPARVTANRIRWKL